MNKYCTGEFDTTCEECGECKPLNIPATRAERSEYFRAMSEGEEITAAINAKMVHGYKWHGWFVYSKDFKYFKTLAVDKWFKMPEKKSIKYEILENGTTVFLKTDQQNTMMTSTFEKGTKGIVLKSMANGQVYRIRICEDEIFVLAEDLET